MHVEDYMLNGICEGCDQDPAGCYNLGYCKYDGPEIKEEEKRSLYNIYAGDTADVNSIKCIAIRNCTKEEVLNNTELLKSCQDSYYFRIIDMFTMEIIRDKFLNAKPPEAKYFEFYGNK